MPIKQAQKYFLQPGHNCTQAVIKAFQPFLRQEHNLDDYSAYGYGQSEEGKCGALVGAQIICGKEHEQDIEKKFIEKAKSPFCKEIRRLKTLGCRSCVKEAALIVSSILKTPQK